MLARSSGECGNSIWGPNDSMSRWLVDLAADHRGLEPGVHGGDYRRLAEQALVDDLGGSEPGRVEVGPPAAVVELLLEGAARQPAGRVERGDHVGHRGVVGRARQAVQREPVAVRDRLAERRRRLDEVVEVRAQRERPRRDEGDRVEQPFRVLLAPRVGRRGLGGRHRDRDAGVRLRERVANRLVRLPDRVAERVFAIGGDRDDGHRVARDRVPALPAVERDEAERDRRVRLAERAAEHLDRVRPAERDPGARVPALPSAHRDGERRRAVCGRLPAARRCGSTCPCSRRSRRSGDRPPRCRG